MPERFTLIDRIGKGGMGVVWKAVDGDTGEKVALKVLHSQYAEEKEYVARFEREVEISRRIDSLHVVKVLGYGKQDGVPYMAMELVDGQSLRDLILQRGKLSWEEAKPIYTQVVDGLAAAHRVGVIHRDLKPSNILIGTDGIVKLADFGIARASDLTALTGGATMLGTPYYMAPEDGYSAQSDIYSLGCVLYEMLVGAPPFVGDSTYEVIRKHMRDAPDLSVVPDPPRQLVGAMLQKDPALRPQSAAALIGDGLPQTPAMAAAPGRVGAVIGMEVHAPAMAAWEPRVIGAGPYQSASPLIGANATSAWRPGSSPAIQSNRKRPSKRLSYTRLATFIFASILLFPGLDWAGHAWHALNENLFPDLSDRVFEFGDVDAFILYVGAIPAMVTSFVWCAALAFYVRATRRSTRVAQLLVLGALPGLCLYVPDILQFHGFPTRHFSGFLVFSSVLAFGFASLWAMFPMALRITRLDRMAWTFLVNMVMYVLAFGVLFEISENVPSTSVTVIGSDQDLVGWISVSAVLLATSAINLAWFGLLPQHHHA